MSNRCESCAKLVGLSFEEPEVEDEAVDKEGHVTATIQLKRNCADCGGEMKQASLDLAHTVEGTCASAGSEGHELSVEISAEQLEEGGGRYKKSYFGADCTITVTCLCGAKAEAPWSDKLAAGDFENV